MDHRPSRARTYLETFDTGPGGWYADRHHALPVWDGVAYCHSPWWLDANHAPPGAGYLHLLMWTFTDRRWYAGGGDEAKRLPYGGSRFAEEEIQAAGPEYLNGDAREAVSEIHLSALAETGEGQVAEGSPAESEEESEELELEEAQAEASRCLACGLTRRTRRGSPESRPDNDHTLPERF